MDYNPKTVKFDGKRLVFIGTKQVNFQKQQVEICLEVDDKIEFIVPGWNEDPYGQFYICQGTITKIELQPYQTARLQVSHNGIESEIGPVDIQKKLGSNAVLAPRRCTAWY